MVNDAYKREEEEMWENCIRINVKEMEILVKEDKIIIAYHSKEGL